MEQNNQNADSNEVRESKMQELQIQQDKLKEIKAGLGKLNKKILSKEKLALEDTKYIGDLGWLAALSVSIAALASSM